MVLKGKCSTSYRPRALPVLLETCPTWDCSFSALRARNWQQQYGSVGAEAGMKTAVIPGFPDYSWRIVLLKGASRIQQQPPQRKLSLLSPRGRRVSMYFSPHSTKSVLQATELDCSNAVQGTKCLGCFENSNSPASWQHKLK